MLVIKDNTYLISNYAENFESIQTGLEQVSKNLRLNWEEEFLRDTFRARRYKSLDLYQKSIYLESEGQIEAASRAIQQSIRLDSKIPGQEKLQGAIQKEIEKKEKEYEYKLKQIKRERESREIAKQREQANQAI